MGCGISQAVLRGNDDLSKSDAFLRLCTGEKNPIAMQLNGYFNSLVSECLYKSQGDMAGYERLFAKRLSEVTVNRSRLAAQRHGIGHKPLTVDGVNDIMNLFLGHIIKSLERRKWSGTFNYALMQPLVDAGAVESDKAKTNLSSANSRNSCAQTSAVKNSNPSFNRPMRPAADSVVVAARGGDAATAAESAAELQSTALPSSRKSKASAFSMQSSVAARSSTLVFVDHGNGTQKDDDPNRQWRMELTGNITYPSVDGALTLICDCKVAFLFFTCDDQLPAVPSTAKLSEDTALPSHFIATQQPTSVPVGLSASATNDVHGARPAQQPQSSAFEAERNVDPGSGKSKTDGGAQCSPEPRQPAHGSGVPIAAAF